MYKFKWINSEKEYRKWDEFLYNEPVGHGSQSSDWLKSYRSYGFTFNILAVFDDNKSIVGGIGIVISKFGFLKMASCPYGPIIRKGNEEIFHKIIERAGSFSKATGAITLQINFPFLESYENKFYEKYCLAQKLIETEFNDSRSGNVLKEVIAVNGFRSVYIDLTEDNPYENLFKRFSTNTKRNIKKANKHNLELVYANNPSKIEEAYRLVEQNAVRKGYSVRSWSEFGTFLINLVEKNYGLIPVCYKYGKIQGALIVFNFGHRLTYIMGGHKIGETDFKVGHFLHNEMIKLSIEKGYSFYDISVGGSKGVLRFKKGFDGRHIKFLEPRYWIYKPKIFKLYQNLKPFLKKHKKLISKILKWIN